MCLHRIWWLLGTLHITVYPIYVFTQNMVAIMDITVYPIYVFTQNMVGPGEVDEDLEPETAEECQKYGKVCRCVIFEVIFIWLFEYYNDIVLCHEI